MFVRVRCVGVCACEVCVSVCEVCVCRCSSEREVCLCVLRCD